MPHAITSAAPGLQAVILCGPGNSFSTFMGNPDENPKALLPIANRPMVWYPIDFCYRMGITDITLICPPSAAAAITEALNTNPVLTSLPSPKPDLLAPKDLDQNTGTAEIFRLPEVKALIKSDFVVLPCDLLCELGGDKLLQTWMVEAASLSDLLSPKNSSHSGGLGVWYETKTAVPFVKKEETDFLGITTLGKTLTSVPKASLTRHVSKIVYSMPKDSVNDIIDEKEGFPVRSLLGDERSRIRLLTGHRDAHIYIFPRWVLQFIDENPSLDTLGEDVIGLWAKATWQKGLAEKLQLLHILARSADIADDEPSQTPSDDETVEQGRSLATKTAVKSRASERDVSTLKERGVPPVLAYVHPAKSEQLVRRVDTPALLLALSLQLAKLSPIEEAGVESASPFAHQRKVAYPEGVKPRTTITRQDCLIGENVTVDEKSSIKESVVGVNCQIQEGAKLHQCLLMEGAVVGKGCKLTRCILGKRCVIGEGSTLTDVEVQENLLVEPRTEEAKAQLTKGLIGSGEDMDDDLPSGDGDDNAGADMIAAE